MTATLVPRPTAPPPAPTRDDTPAGDRAGLWLARLFAGDFPFPSVQPAPLPPGDRSAAEYAAASRAAGCRDLFVVHADPLGGERVIADVARACSDRVLVLSPDADAADRVAERLLACGVPVLRALADDENPTRPSPAVSKVTSAALGASRAEQARREAAIEVTAAERRLAAFAGVSKVLARLAEVNDALARLDADRADQAARRDRIDAETRAETDTPFAQSLARAQAEHDDAAARLAAELQAATALHAEKEAALAQARHAHAEAAHKPGFLSRLFSGKTKPGTPDPAELEKQVHALEGVVTGLADQVRDLRAKADAATAARTAGREQLVAAEIETRRAASAAALEATEAERGRAQAEAAALERAVAAAVPGEDYATGVRKLAAAREKVAEATRATAAATAARVVVGTPRSLDADPVFAAPADPAFGVLILDRAEELPEAAFPKLARLAERWVLVGHAVAFDGPPLGGPRGRGRSPEVPFAARLARLLDREPWAVEGNRLVCRLAHATAAERRGMTREPLADRPEIELRFVATAADPLLAEIAFPGNTPLPDAKSFLFHELNEVLLRPCGEVVWDHTADAITATWPAADTGPGVWIDLEAGVREKVTGAGACAFTAAIQFNPAEGWTAESAATWLARHLPPSPSRFAALPRR